MRILFTRMGLLDLIQYPKPQDATAAWTRANGWAFSEISFRVKPELQRSLNESMTAREAWLAIEEQYQSSSHQNIFRLMIEFNSSRQLPGESAQNFTDKVIEAAELLKYLGEDISDQRIKWHILGNLLPEFGPLVTTLTNIDSPERPMDTRQIRDAIIREELSLQRNRAMQLSNTAPITMPNQTIVPYTSLATTNNGNTSKCSGCNRFGHSENRCWVLYPHLRPPRFQRNGEELPEKHAEIEGRNKKDKGKKTEKKDKKQRHNNRVDKKSNHKPKKESRREKGKTKPKPDDTESEEKENTGTATSLNMVHYTNNIPYIPCVPRNTPFIDHAAMMRTTQRTIQRKTRWMFDSGASNHYTSRRSQFESFQSIPSIKIETASGFIYGTGKGDVLLNLSCGVIRIPDVVYVPDLKEHTNLISVGQLEDSGMEITMRNGRCYVWQKGSLWASGTREHFVYYLDEMTEAVNNLITYPMNPTNTHTSHKTFPALLDQQQAESDKADIQPIEVWHRRMGHLNKKYMLRLRQLSEGIEFGEAPRKHKFDCVDCIKAQQHKQISKYPVRRPADKLEIVYADICGPMQTPDFWGHTYFMTIICARHVSSGLTLCLRKMIFQEFS